MFNKLKAAMPDFDINEISQKIKQSITEPDPTTLKPRLTPSCELIEVRSGKLPAIVIINGFMSEKEESAEDWLEVVDELYPLNQVIRVKWKAGNLKDMMFEKGAVPETPISNSGKLGAVGAILARTNIMAMAATFGAVAVNKIGGHWKKSFYETRHVAHDLAKKIEETPELNNCILMGHSLGGRILRHTLNELVTPNIVSVAYIFAGAVSSQSDEWQPLVTKHNKLKLINCMSKSDYVLKSAYKAGTLWDHEPAGLAPILENTHKFILNLDVTKYASGHMNFKQKELGRFLKTELTQLNEDKLKLLHLVS